MSVGFAMGCILGMVMMVGTTNSNMDFDSAIAYRYKIANELCGSIGSAPKSMDLDDELVCDNGATFNYREYTED